ncbi:hypothetical protein QEG98_29105 [Myxococcus sp. MxC21-1]|uniref:hypothetical protein n=1 Tax=Myxococcus sp. MxC21-1 TaxID=3041439 RepID=UPI002931D390|nr:hypothetical protein [Myxococcus sp. MxC21-1]WNZ60057.1 hypothetical protein QEG98_29105 [Myxococcus sp. MxC21-1]
MPRILAEPAAYGQTGISGLTRCRHSCMRADIQDVHRIVGVWQRVSGSVEELTP